jgi:hypothetical protein
VAGQTKPASLKPSLVLMVLQHFILCVNTLQQGRVNVETFGVDANEVTYIER